MEQLMNFNNTLNFNHKNYNDCNKLLKEYVKTSIQFINVNKNHCITNSCRRRKEEIIGSLKKIHDQISICE